MVAPQTSSNNSEPLANRSDSDSVHCSTAADQRLGYFSVLPYPTNVALSVIVCTRNRSYAITDCLDSISRSLTNAAPIQAEVVVVDNGSTDATSTRVMEWAKSCDVPVHLVYEPAKGLSNARNRGILAANGRLLAFTDDDCRLSDNYITDLLRHDANDTEPVLRGGSVRLGDEADLPLSIKTTVTPVQRSLAANSARHANIGDTLIGCNMTMRREIADRLGLFDARFGAGTLLPGGEETDYIFRAYLANILIAYVPDMIVYHYHGRRTIEAGRALMRNYAIGTGALYAKYLFVHFDLCRSFIWDCRKAFKELATKRNTFSPAINFSHVDWVTWCVIGMFRYLRLNLSSLGLRR